MEYITPVSDAPENFLFWSAVTVISATLKRHVWYLRGLRKMYPNLYTVLVGKPGTGKGEAANPAIDILSEANTANILSDRLTMEFILERLAKGFQSKIHTSTGGFTFGTESTALIYSPEMSILIMSPRTTLPTMADLWDCRERPFDYGTRYKGSYVIEKPGVSLFACSAEEWLARTIPNEAVGGGFTRRVNYVHSKTVFRNKPWPITSNSGSSRSDLISDLRHISSLRGEFNLDGAAKPLFEKYYRSSKADEFDDEATALYKNTKWVHITKLAMALSLSRDDDLVIAVQDMLMAENRINKVIESLPLVFRAVGESDLVSAADKVLRFLELHGNASIKDILRVNWKHVTYDTLMVILTTLIQGGLVKEEARGNKVIYSSTQGGKP